MRKINIKNYVLDYKIYKQLNWHGQVPKGQTHINLLK